MKLEELERLAREATPGPWSTDQHGLGINVPDGYSIAALYTKSGAMRDHFANARYIAAVSPDALLKLIAVCKAAERVVTSNEGDLMGFFAKIAEMREALAALEPKP